MKIYLSPIKESDGNLIVRWRNSPKVKEHCFTKGDVTLESNAKFYKENILTGKYKQYLVNRVEEQYDVASYPIATVYLKDIDNENKRCELCIFTSDDEEWNTESQKIAIEMLLKKAFDEFKMHKVYSYVYAKNTDEITLLKESGMNEEAILKKEAMLNGKFEDVIRLCAVID